MFLIIGRVQKTKLASSLANFLMYIMHFSFEFDSIWSQTKHSSLL